MNYSYTFYHSSLTSAVNSAEQYAIKNGYSISQDELTNKVGFGPAKPSEGNTNSYHLELITEKGNVAKKLLHIQVYNRGYDIKLNYELNCYIS